MTDLMNPALEAVAYRLDPAPNTKELRIVFRNEADKVIGYFFFDSDEAYEFATDILAQYDILEGIK